MNSPLWQSFLFVFLIINAFPTGHCNQYRGNSNKVYRKLRTATSHILSSFVPPLCAHVFNNSGVRSQYISSKGLSGRVIPSGTFLTLDLGMDVLYGDICPVGLTPSYRTYAKAVQLVRVTYDLEFLITQSESIFDLTNGRRLTIFAASAFDKNYKLCGIDAQIRGNGLAFPLGPNEKELMVTQICTLADNYCTGALQQYINMNDCIQYITTQIPLGSYDQGDQSNIACRFTQSYLIPINATRYCARIGRDGGDYCTDKTIDFYYNQPDFLACAHKYK